MLLLLFLKPDFFLFLQSGLLCSSRLGLLVVGVSPLMPAALHAGVRVGDVQVRFMDGALLCAVWNAFRRTVADGRAHRDREAWRVVVAQLTARVAQLEAALDAAARSKAAEAG